MLNLCQFYEFGAYRSIDAELEIWSSNLTLKDRKVTLELSFFDLLSDWMYKEKHEFQLAQNQTTELSKIRCPCPNPTDQPTTVSYSVVAAARLLDPRTGEVIARYADWPQPFRYVDFPNPGLKVSINGETITVEASKPVKGLVFSTDGDGEEVKWSDNALDVVPDDKQVIVAAGLGGRALKVAYMGKEIATKL
jgi:beta-mannosidase